MNSSTSRQLHRRLVLPLLWAALLLSGCMQFEYENFRPLPGPGRDGRLYCYTEDYFKDNTSFSLVGKTIVKSDRSWLLPLPGTIFPGLPLYGLEKYVICPVVDTLLIPYDLYLKARNAYVCAHDGLWVTMLDCDGRPIPNVDIRIAIGNCLAPSFQYAPLYRRVIYDGKPIATMSSGIAASLPHVVTDEKGEAYIPIDFGSCTYICLRWTVQTPSNKQGEQFVVWIDGGVRWEQDKEARNVLKPRMAHLTRLLNGMSWHIERRSHPSFQKSNHYPLQSPYHKLNINFGESPDINGKKRIFLHLPVAVEASPQTAARTEVMRKAPEMTEEPSPQ